MARAASASSVRRPVIPRPVLFRALRAAIVIPAAYAIGTQLLGNADIGLFAAIGSVSMLLFVDFGGSVRQRAQSHTGLVVGGMAFVALGTACSGNIWVATSVTLVVCFGILFSGVVSSVLAGAQPALLISFLLPVTFPGPISSTPDRLLGWLLAGVASGIAILFIPPGRSVEPVRALTAEACRMLGAELLARGTAPAGPSEGASGTPGGADQARSEEAVAALRNAFFATPYRPSGLSRSARAVVQIAEQVIALHSSLDRSPQERTDAELAAFTTMGVSLQRSADVLGASRPDLGVLPPCRSELQRTRDQAELAITGSIPRTLAVAARGHPPAVADMLERLEPAFGTQDATVIVDAIVEQVQQGALARRRDWWQHLIDWSAAWSARDRIGAHLNWRSVWLHNSIRGALGFATTVFVADLLGVEHAFWVVFGTLAVLRSNAANTGQTAVLALAGTLIGLLIGIPLVLAIGSDVAVAWVLLPVSIAIATVAPSISFMAGQAGFTITLLLLFAIVQPVGLQLGIVRIEDVALGAGVSVLVTLLLWPRGATARLNAALSAGFDSAAQYLSAATRYALLRGLGDSADVVPPASDRELAADAARRLDDAFRQFLSERGAKSVDLSELTSLVVAVAAVRRTAAAICDLWGRADEPPDGTETATRSEILFSQAVVVGWYRHAAAALVQAAPVPGVPLDNGPADARLLDALRRDLGEPDERQAMAAFKLTWTNHHIRVARIVAADITPAVAAAAESGAQRRAWLFPRAARSGRRTRAATA
ncbi:FUSC family protein [Leifsonia sp. NPDC058248]|uniref:FUSC family protein n=1 Tax=Leifsonia sp. NPDC058248 TaxID=3346402 RepID=UPI0036D860A6